MSNWWGIDLQPLIDEVKKVSLSQEAIAKSQTLTNSLLKEQNELLKKYLEQK